MVNLEIGATASSYEAYIRLFMNIITGLVVVGTIIRCLIVSSNYLSGEQPLSELGKKLKKIIFAAILCGSVPQIIRLIAVAYGS